MVDHERQRRRLAAARRPGANVARPLTDFPVGRCEVHVPREHANGERFWTWCSVVGVKEGRLLVDVPEPFGNVVTPMTIAFLEKHREMSDRDFVRSATVEADSCDERKPSLLPPPASKKPRVAPKASQPQPVAAPVPRVVLKLQEPAADSTSAASSVQQLLLAAKLAEKERPSGDGLAQQQRQRQLTTAVKKPTTPPSLWPSEAIEAQYEELGHAKCWRVRLRQVSLATCRLPRVHRRRRQLSPAAAAAAGTGRCIDPERRRRRRLRSRCRRVARRRSTCWPARAYALGHRHIAWRSRCLRKRSGCPAPHRTGCRAPRS